MAEHRLSSRCRLVCLRKRVNVLNFMHRVPQESVQRCVPVPLMGGFCCHCDEQGEMWLNSHPDVESVEEDLSLDLPRLWTAGDLRLWTSAEPSQIGGDLPSGLRLIRAPQAWEITEGSGVDVAIIDSGVDLRHPDLAPNIARGINLIQPGAPPEDSTGHGTLVAGIALAEVSRHMAGVAPRGWIHPVKVIGRQGAASLSNLVIALQWVADQRMDVANMSLGTRVYSMALERAVSNALNRGVTLVASAGNDGDRSVTYPAAFPGVITVTAIDLEGMLAPFSNSGAEVDLAAPGVQILSTANGGGYARASGTSFAAPFVSGVAALYLRRHPSASPAQVRRHLIRTAVPLPRQNDALGVGRVDAWNAVSERT